MECPACNSDSLMLTLKCLSCLLYSCAYVVGVSHIIWSCMQLQMIMGAVEAQPGGCAHINQLAVQQLRAWITTEVGIIAMERGFDAPTLASPQVSDEAIQIALLWQQLGEVQAARGLFEKVYLPHLPHLAGSRIEAPEASWCHTS